MTRLWGWLVFAALAGCTETFSNPGPLPDLATGATSTDGGGGGAMIDELLAAHNQVRQNAMPAPAPALALLTWSQAAADVATAWAANCDFSHNPSRGALGENIFGGSGSYTPAQVAAAWASEAANYNYATNGCNGVCGHYTQLVWRTTSAVGCAKKRCTTASPLGNNWEYWVCDYSPPGNFNGQKPY